MSDEMISETPVPGPVAQRRKPGPKPKVAVAAAPASAPAAVASAAVAEMDAGPMFVVAKHPGTYPRVGETYGRFRKRGECFQLNRREDFTPFWMVESDVDGNADLPPDVIDGRIPQTTGGQVVRDTSRTR